MTTAAHRPADVDLALPPASLPAAVRAELRRTVRPPYETPGAVLVNGALMVACWTQLPPGVVDAVFRFHGPLAFPMVLACWMYADVPATNLLGADPAGSLAALADPPALRRLWYAKNLVLWLSATPLCVLVAIGIGMRERQPAAAALAVVWILVVPVGVLGFAGCVGVAFPYHRLPLRQRWVARRSWRRMLVRWVGLLAAPYVVVPALTVVLTLPSVLLWAALDPGGSGRRLGTGQFATGVVAGVAIAALAWPVGHRCGSRLATRRRDRLAAFLADPRRG
jgi:hypothetical protein